MFLGIKYIQNKVRCDKKVKVFRDKGYMYNCIELRIQEMRFVEILVFLSVQIVGKLLERQD